MYGRRRSCAPLPLHGRDPALAIGYQPTGLGPVGRGRYNSGGERHVTGTTGLAPPAALNKTTETT